ncbi:MAG: glutaconyl-CoA/methylmalonyl-CoA decarboxylase subunit gamma [Halanaerobiales bacterium]|nr:glutaconyl-CoA/methylmalonyl-CoA decarboxylase subunit gamma [Halanaerobiales bacterium]
MKKFRVRINDQTYEVEVEEIKDAVVKKETPRTETKVEKPVEKAAPKPAAAPGDVTGEKVVAPLPGTISLEVSEGDSVSEGDVLFVLEAMKMENEITAPVSGTVKSIFVSEGASVDTGDLLAVIE